MPENKNKILVALDGSERSLKTIEYLCRFKPFLTKELALCNIITKVPEYYYDLQKEPFSHGAASRVRAWELGHRSEMEEFMEKSRMKLIASGFKPEAISVHIAERKRGIARDMLNEAQKGYYSLMLRRRGRARSILSLVLGSVSKKLVENAVDVPIMLAGVRPVTHSLFLAVDRSEGAKRAVEFTAETIRGSKCRIVLCSVLRDFEVLKKKMGSEKLADCNQSADQEVEESVEQAAEILIKAGIKSEDITKKIVKGVRSRAAAIVEAMLEEHCDTVVFGRKGTSEVSEFNIGRIPWKVIHGAKEMTVWIIP